MEAHVNFKRLYLFTRMSYSGLADVTNIFPHVINAIAVAAPFIYGVLASGAISSSIDLIKGVKEVQDALRKKRQPATQAQPEQGKQQPQPVIGPIEINLYISIERSIVSMAQTLQASGLNADEREQKSATIIITLASDPEGAKTFLDKLKEKK